MSYELTRGGDIDAVAGVRSLRGAQRVGWQSAFVRRLAVTDAIAVFGAVGTAQLLRFDGPEDPPLAWPLPYEIGYSVVSLVLAAGWLALLHGYGSRTPQVIGAGSEEFRRLVSASLKLFGVLAILALLFRIEFARGYLAIALPAGLLGLIAGRLAWRWQLRGLRADGHCQASVLVVGSPEAARAMASAFTDKPDSGYRVVGVCVPPGAGADVETVGGASVLGDDRSVLEAVRRSGADSVAVAATDHLGPAELRRMAWDLDPLGVDLIVAPGVVDIAGIRLNHRLVAGMPMLHIDRPRYGRAKSRRKAAFDFCFAAAVVLSSAPLLLAIAVAVKLSSPGPVFYLSERIGRDGTPFRMIKFRSMQTGADLAVHELIAEHGGNPVFFKVKDDPRVTPVGRFLRRYSLDELPQFFNVLRGEMSVVGPRPQVQREVDAYDGEMRRRLLVKPGLTGLWQVSGRSDLSPEDSVRLDLSYVENWSMVLDLALIARTIGVVTRGEGAY
ncbi:sugar transferase [Nocardia rhizosphaerae]|uniref:Sugar transferase n=1 Tax=Nocardia rhizosphaerae TaxID=1691571 RepID=A0ABV8LBA6_9NOCA